MGVLNGIPRFQPNDEQRMAMRLVEGLVNDGHLVLEPDRYVPNGGLRFQRPIPASTPPTMRTRDTSITPSLAALMIALAFLAGVAVGAKMAGSW